MTLYVLLKRDLFECPKHLGYTGIKDLAGTWTAEEFARWDIETKAKYDRYCRDHYALPFEVAPDFTNACFHDLAQAHLEKKLAVAMAENQKLRASAHDIIKQIAQVSNAVGFQAGEPAMEMAGQIVSVLAANPEHIERFMVEGSGLFIDGTFNHENGSLTYRSIAGDILSPDVLREMKGIQQ